MKTIRAMTEEIEDLEIELLDAKAALYKSRPQWQEDYLKSEGRYPAGDTPRSVLAKRVELLEAKLERKREDSKSMEAAQLPRDGGRFARGELNEEIGRLAKRDGCKSGKSVDGKTRRKWLKEIKASGKTTSDGAIRATLTSLGLTKERKPKK